MCRTSKGFLALLVTLLLSAAAVPAQGAVPPGTSGDGAAGQTVRVYVEAAGSIAEALEKEIGVRHRFPRGFSADVPRHVADELARRQGVTVRPVAVREPLGPGAGKAGKPASTPRPQDRTPWGVEVVYDDPALEAVPRYGGRAVVAILDTGVAPHPDLEPPAQCRDFTGRAPYVDGRCADRDGHGTHVTGTIAATGGESGTGIFGVAPGIRYYSYKVCNSLCFGDDVAAAIREAVRSGANIISMSLGGEEPDALEQEAIREAAARGVLIVAAAGNTGPDPGTVLYPAAFPEVVAVASLYQVEPHDVRADNLSVNSWSARGVDDGDDRTISEGEVEVAAPGYEVESTWKDGGYVVLSGTSMATPHVTGLAALVWDELDGDARRVREWLRNRAKQYDITRASGGGAGPGYDIASGYGNPRYGGR
ncbi:S8 family serine peptidase [Caldinitratiruptor microaerophilus]|uniref:Peptidase S8/S53 domain-containing protein n=1 Tax=Caldinitratiruptor microaerophilus TaxID=671077 RepID=A0AA35G8J7_9FIRM|nr:S8 family serine peptidase [Caldinitratiruptor microaerophilus]BDG61085.1 hypothetical protein caldi_21750 [Caldinitratiruptor microaerophilus]